MLRRLEDWGGLRRLLGGLSVLLHRVCCCGNWEGGLLQLLLGLLRLLRGGGGEVLLLLLLLLLLLRLLRCVSFLCWGSELWLQGLGGLSATVRLDVAGAGARPSSAC